MSLLNADDDWQESFRRTWYPVFHRILEPTGALIGIPLYAKGGVGWNQYVGELDEDEEVIEEELVELSSERNPISALKILPDGRVSEGSWVFLHEDYPGLIEEGMQLHLTLFERKDGNGRVIYAHYEDDWRDAPISHLRAANFSAEDGVEKSRRILDAESFLELHTDR